MARVAVLKESIARVGISDLGDIVSIYDDDVDLTGSGYAEFYILYLPQLSVSDVYGIIDSLTPIQIEVEGEFYYDGKKGLVPVSDIDVKYPGCLENITESDVNIINNSGFTREQILSFIDTKIVSKIQKAIDAIK